jgi:hypothetical protein
MPIGSTSRAVPARDQRVTPRMRQRLARGFVCLLGAWLCLTTSLVTLAVWGRPRQRAVILMAWGLILLWIGVGGALSFLLRERVGPALAALRLDWRVQFVLFATILALIEEAITTTMTNLAPWFGVRVGEAYITASANYLDVVGLHSVVMFVGMFVGWALLLWRWRFTPFQVFLLFGLTGLLAESLTFGLQHLAEFGLWTLVYGLMVYLPACCVPPGRPARPVRWWHFPIATVFPILCVPLSPFPWIRLLLFHGHPGLHFPPMQ